MPLFAKLKDRAESGTFLANATRQRSTSSWISTGLLILVGLPLWLIVTVPAVAVAIPIKIVQKLVGAGPKKMKRDLLTKLSDNKIEAGPALAGRPIDVVVFGATGLTGGYLLEYLQDHHPHLIVALGGRNLKKLEKVRDARGKPDQQLIVADSSDIDSLVALCRQTKVVASTVGPFKRYGNEIYHACAHTGTHYADITGESDWVSHMGKIYGPVAERTGASLVSYCGVDSVPSDVGAFLACSRFEKVHGSSAKGCETVITRFKGGAPGGTIDTVAGVADGTDVLQRPPEGSRESSKGKTSKAAAAAAGAGMTNIENLMSPLSRASQFKQWTVPFFMAPTNSQAVRRTNRLVGYAPNLSYSERWGFKDAPSALAIVLGVYIMGAPWIMLSPLRSVLRAAGVLPKQGSGSAAMTEDTCASGSVSLLVAATGVGQDGAPAATRLRFSGVGDPGVGHTAVCQGEVAALLAKQLGETRAGAVTPVAAVGGEALAAALVDTGLVFIDDAPAELLR